MWYCSKERNLERVQRRATKFLGIIIDDKLCWSSHLNYINLKLSRSLYILNSIKRMVPMPHLKMLYYTMIHSYLAYGITIWGKTFQSYLKRTIILQKKAITNNLFRTSGMLKVNELYKLEVAKVMFYYTNFNLPDPILNLFISNLIVHQHNTRQTFTSCN